MVRRLLTGLLRSKGRRRDGPARPPATTRRRRERGLHGERTKPARPKEAAAPDGTERDGVTSMSETNGICLTTTALAKSFCPDAAGWRMDGRGIPHLHTHGEWMLTEPSDPPLSHAGNGDESDHCRPFSPANPIFQIRLEGFPTIGPDHAIVPVCPIRGA